MDMLASKWQKVWQQSRSFEPKMQNGKKFYLTAAFPYPNSPQHIGHARTYTTTDIYARFKRMQGYNVLFPMGFHVTGTPILAMAKRIGEKDPEILGIFDKIYGISPSQAEKLTNPVDLVLYFSNEIEQGMKEIGFSIDWRRKFYSSDAHFNKFIEWQFRKLQKLGYIKQGTHPVPWCPSDNNSVSAHDTRGDVDPQLEEVTVVKFRFKDGFLLCTTYRPETLYGVTNIWANQTAAYVKAKAGNEVYYLSKDAAAAFSNQMELKVISEFGATELIGSSATNLLTNAQVPIFEASFVESAQGTGIVMSVPAHAPYDYLALRDLGQKAAGIIPINVIKLDGFGEFPAKDIVEKMGITNQDDPKAEDATKEIYKKEAHSGIMAQGKYAGLKAIAAKEKIREDLIKEGHAFAYFEISNSPVYCRCGAKVIAKLVQGQWFIDYGNEGWKKATHGCLDSMTIFPDKSRQDLNYTIDWLKEKACTRAAGLGTKFPFDKSQIIESLSDSTIYMAFYTISHIVKALDAQELDDEFFNYVFLGAAMPLPRQPTQSMRDARAEFEYWYPLDSRHSGADLIHNHLAFLIFNHVAIFPKEKWPRQIVSNGFVTMDGKKMSKSMGNILPLRNAIEQYGADVVRFSVVNGAELKEDSDFSQSAATGVMSRMKFVSSLITKAAQEKSAPTSMTIADKWLLSRLHKRLGQSIPMYEQLAMRELGQELFFGTLNDLSWYLKRTKEPHLREFFEYWIAAVSPIMPHFAEEAWQSLSPKLYVHDSPLICNAQFPKPNDARIDPKVEEMESLVIKTRDDIEHIATILKLAQKPQKIRLFVASQWKHSLLGIVLKNKSAPISIKEAMQDPEIKPQGALVPKIVMQYMKNINSLQKGSLSPQDELDALNDAKSYFESEFGCPFEIEPEENSGTHMQKAQNSLPNKVAIVIVTTTPEQITKAD